MKNRKGGVNMKEKVTEKEKSDKKESVIKEEKGNKKVNVIEEEKGNKKVNAIEEEKGKKKVNVIEEEKGNKKVRVTERVKERRENNEGIMKEKVVRNQKVAYILLVIGLLCVIKAVYSYGEMGIVAQGRIGDDISVQTEEQTEEQIEEQGAEGDEVAEVSTETGNDEKDCAKEDCDGEDCSVVQACDGKDCDVDQCCDNNGKEDDKESDEEKCNLCAERLEEFDREDCIVCSDCKDCLECVKCQECSDCVKCEGREECSDCGKCEECVECSECQGCVQCERCLDCEYCMKCSDCKGDIIYTEDQLPRVLVKEPDGAYGYYLNPPQITIIHQLERVEVHYRFTNGAGELTEGIIPEGQDLLLDNRFKDGENSLLVWVELPDQIWEDYRVLRLDSHPPSIPEINIDNAGRNGAIHSNEGVSVSFQSFDSGSGVYGYFYKIGNHNEIFIMEEIGTITINEEFVGQVEVTAIDYAGNRSEVSRSSSIIIDKNQPIIKVSSTGELGAWNHQAVSVEVQVEEWGVSSGLKEVRVYLDGEVILGRKLSESELEYSFRETLSIEKEGLNGVGANIIVEARDNVGHEALVHHEVLIDTIDPTIRFLDAFNNMIIGSDRTIEIILEDNNLLRYYQVQTTHLPFGEEEGEGDSHIKGDINNTSQSLSIPLEKEGRYTIEVLARDISGREAVNTIHVSLDKTSPIIRYVEQLNGKHIPHFQWNYQSEDMIQDEHGFDYNMFLNGGRYLEGNYVDREGEYTFRVTAVDEGGNINSAYADFVIDNTSPEIYFYNVEKDESYEEQLMVGIAVTGHGERIKRVVVNGENSNIERNSQMVQLRFARVGDYVIVVEADDLAGNVSIEEVAFSIVESLDETTVGAVKKTGVSGQIEKVFERVGSILPSGRLNPSEGNLNRKGVIGIGLALLVVAGGVVFVLLKGKIIKKEKERGSKR